MGQSANRPERQRQRRQQRHDPRPSAQSFVQLRFRVAKSRQVNDANHEVISAMEAVKNRESASRRPAPPAAFPAKAGTHPSCRHRASSNRNKLLTDEPLVQPSDGPQLSLGKRAKWEANLCKSTLDGYGLL